MRDSTASAPATREPRFREWLHWANCGVHNLALQPHNYFVLTRLLGLRDDRIRFRPLRTMDPMPLELGASVQAILGTAPSHLPLQAQIHRIVMDIPGPWRVLGGNEPLWRFPLLLDSELERDRLFAQCQRHGLGASRMYRRTLPELASDAVLTNAGPTASMPAAAEFAQRLLTLPLHRAVTASDLCRLRALLERFDARCAAA